MNIENENNEVDDVESDEIAEMDAFVEEAKEQLGIDENLNPIKEEIEPESEVEPEPEPVVVDELDDDDSDDEDTGIEPSADDSTEEEEDTSASDSDEESENAFRSEFAERHGFSQESVAGYSVEQLETLGVELDRKLLNGLQEPQQQQPFQPQPPQPQQQPFVNQQDPQGQQQVNFEQLRKQAEEGGYEEEFINSLNAMEQQHLQVQQQNEYFIQQQQLQQQRAVQETENLFDKSLESIGLPEIFGADRQSAFNNGIQFEARKQLYNKAVAFSQVSNEPLTEGLVDRVARVMFADQFKQKQKTELVRKAKSQSKKKLGSGVTRTKSQSQKRKIETGNDDIASIVNDPEIAAFAEEHGML